MPSHFSPCFPFMGTRNDQPDSTEAVPPDALILGMLFDELVDQIHGFQGVSCDPLQTGFGVFQRGEIPFRFASYIDVAQSDPNVTEE